MLKTLWISVGVFLMDQLAKLLAVEYLLGRPPVEILPGFDLQLVYNTGAAFGMLDDAGGWQNALFIAIAAGVSLFIVYSLRRLSRSELQIAVSYALILGGALANVVDRVRYGYVVDFIHWFYKDFHWPNFNLADAAISIGAALLVMDVFGVRIIGRHTND
ncbi:MAG: Lipoprotein signal peptidase [Gammaproteobacteria bacterium]|nr:Lipoprotein signal peptidase [Gammaproteobacteria bacterium]